MLCSKLSVRTGTLFLFPNSESGRQLGHGEPRGGCAHLYCRPQKSRKETNNLPFFFFPKRKIIYFSAIEMQKYPTEKKIQTISPR